MACSCEICGKKSMGGHRISHAHNVSKRLWRPNLRNVRVVVAGGTATMKVCTRCLRSGRVVKPTS